MARLLGNKWVVYGGGFLALLALGVVLGLAIVRIQNPAPTVTQPKAYGSGDWPACTKQGPYAYQGDLGYLSQCCGAIASGAGFDSCSWPARGWCTLAQCGGSTNVGGQACQGSGSNYNKGCRCGLYYQDSSSSCKQGCSASWECYPLGGSYECQNGFCVDTKNPCWVPVPIPKNFTFNSTTQTLNWEYNTTWSSDVKGAVVYVWTSSSKSGEAFAAAGTNAADGHKSAKVSDFRPALSAGTTYYVGISVNSYASPKPGEYECLGDAEKGWSFTSGATTPTEICWNDIDDNGDGNQDEGCTCPANPCPSGKTCSNGTCTTTTTCTVDSDCPTGKVCAEGSCIDPSQSHLACNQTNKTCARKKGSGNNTDGCTTVGTACTAGCTANSDCPTGQVCQNNTCVTPTATGQVDACWGNGGTDGKCYDCNGDGEVNILDFACFRAAYLKNVQ